MNSLLRVIALLGPALILGFPATAEAAKKRDKSKPQTQAKAEEVIPLARLDENFRQDLFATVKKYRNVLQRSPKNDAARQVLADASVALAAQVESAEVVGDRQLASTLSNRFRSDLFDTMWRVGYMAGKGNAEAHATLGLFHRRGVLVERDPEKACSHYRTAAGSGHVAASYHAALCASESDRQNSRGLLERAAVHWHAGAQELMGRACLEAEPRNPECAVKWLSSAAELGRPSAMSLFGWMLANGQGVPRDMDRAFLYYLGAAEKGDVAAQNNVGELYEAGQGIGKDFQQAVHWYRKAAEAGFGVAQFNLGRLYLAGTGVPRDVDAGRRWLEQAEKNGIARARDVILWLESNSTEKKAGNTPD